jgi:hypothetical protein
MIDATAAAPSARIDQPAHFTVKILGSVGEGLAEWFGPLTSVDCAEYQPPVTLLSGIVTDQAGLVGLIRRLHGLGVVLLAVERLDEPM